MNNGNHRKHDQRHHIHHHYFKKTPAKKQDTHAVRIDVVTLGSNRKSLALRLDTPKKKELVYRYGEITFLVEPSLLTACRSIKIDYSPSDL